MPVAVPSLTHRPPSATKNRRRPAVVVTGVRSVGLEPLGPASTSFTRTVLTPVPSVFQISRPLEPSSAEKYTALPATVSCSGDELPIVPGTVVVTVPKIGTNMIPNGVMIGVNPTITCWVIVDGSTSGAMFLSSVALFTTMGLALHSSRPVKPAWSVEPGEESSAANSTWAPKLVSPVGLEAVPGTAEIFRNVAPSKLKTSRSVVSPAGRAENTRMPRALMRPCGSLNTRAWPGTIDGAAPPTDRHSTRWPEAGSKPLK